MLLPNSDLRHGTWECVSYLEESIHPFLNRVEKVNLRPLFSILTNPFGGFYNLSIHRQPEVLFAHLASCGKVPSIKIWRRGFVANNLGYEVTVYILHFTLVPWIHDSLRELLILIRVYWGWGVCVCVFGGWPFLGIDFRTVNFRLVVLWMLESKEEWKSFRRPV